MYNKFSSSTFYKFHHKNFHLQTKHNVLQIMKFLQFAIGVTKSVRRKWQKKRNAHASRCNKNKNIVKFQWNFYEILSILRMFARIIIWSLSWLYKLVNTSKPLVGAECWYTVIVCIMHNVSQVYLIFQVKVKKATRRSSNYCYMSFFKFYCFWIVGCKRHIN